MEPLPFFSHNNTATPHSSLIHVGRWWRYLWCSLRNCPSQALVHSRCHILPPFNRTPLTSTETDASRPPGKTCCAASEGRAESGTAVHAARSHPDRKHYHSFRLGLDRLRPTRPVIYATFLCVCSQNVERLIKIFTELKSRSGLRLIIPDFKLCFLNNFQPVLIISGKNVCGSQMIKDAAVTFLVFLKPL